MGSLCEAAKGQSPFAIHMKPDSAIEAATVDCEKPTNPNAGNDQHEDQPMKQPSRKRNREEFEQQGRPCSVSIASDGESLHYSADSYNRRNEELIREMSDLDRYEDCMYYEKEDYRIALEIEDANKT